MKSMRSATTVVATAALLSGGVGVLVGSQFAQADDVQTQAQEAVLSSDATPFPDATLPDPDDPAVDASQFPWLDSGEAFDERPSFDHNSQGLTYGVPEPGPHGEPDLILAEATNGRTGYVYADDLAGPSFDTPEAAREYTEAVARTRDSFVIPVYEVDGSTVIGEFILTPASP